MPDINIDRLEDIANVPELAEVEEVSDIALLLMESQSLVKLRNIQNRSFGVANAMLKMELTRQSITARKAKWTSGVIISFLLIISIGVVVLSL